MRKISSTGVVTLARSLSCSPLTSSGLFRVTTKSLADDDHPIRLTRIMLRPRIVVSPGPTVEKVRHLVEVAHRECYIANSLRTEVAVQPQVEFFTVQS